jgi:hypothetical protein
MLTTIPEATSARLIASGQRARDGPFPGESPHRQPVHVYGGAHLFTASAIVKPGAVARDARRSHAAGPDFSPPRLRSTPRWRRASTRHGRTAWA